MRGGVHSEGVYTGGTIFFNLTLKLTNQKRQKVTN